MISKLIPKWFMASDIAFISEKIFFHEKKNKKNQNRYLVHFHPCSSGQPESLVDDMPPVLKQCRVLRGRIWKICGICQHLTILSHQYSSCLIENVFWIAETFFSWITIFLWGSYKNKQWYESWMLLDGAETSPAASPRGRARTLENGPRMSGAAPQSNDWHVREEDESTR